MQLLKLMVPLESIYLFVEKIFMIEHNRFKNNFSEFKFIDYHINSDYVIKLVVLQIY